MLRFQMSFSLFCTLPVLFTVGIFNCASSVYKSKFQVSGPCPGFTIILTPPAGGLNYNPNPQLVLNTETVQNKHACLKLLHVMKKQIRRRKKTLKEQKFDLSMSLTLM